MGLQEAFTTSSYQRHHLTLIMTVLGLFDMALGGVIAVFGPGVIGDPTLDSFIRIIGVVFALAGAGILWFGHTRRKAPGAETQTGGAVQRRT